MKQLIVTVFIAGVLNLTAYAIANAKQSNYTSSVSATSGVAMVSTSAQEAYKDIEKTFGFVPEFLKAYPESGIAGAWQEMKSLQLNPDTLLTGRTKELIGLAVAAQIPCHYCTYFHTSAAKLNGANAQEIKEAVALAAMTRHWSTWINGNQIAFATFKKEVDKSIAFAREEMRKATPETMESLPNPVAIMDATSAFKDIEKTMGSVPGFLKSFPSFAVAGAWRAMKDLGMNSMTAINPREKELISLAVAAQVPCDFCIYYHTEAAFLNGASEAELKEAIAMASVTRHWSTVLNGMQINEKKFKMEADKILNPPKPRVAKNK